MRSINGRIGDGILLAQLERREDALNDASNAIDVKASQLFAAAALIAVQPAVLLVQDGMPRWIIFIQAFACILLFAVFIFAHNILKVREYPAPFPTDEWRNRVLAQAGDQAEEDGPALLTWSAIEGISGRINGLTSINERRLRTLRLGRLTLISALLLNFVALAGLVFRGPSSRARSEAVPARDSRSAGAGVEGHYPASESAEVKAAASGKAYRASQSAPVASSHTNSTVKASK
jgi:hypothetical protein